MILILTDTVDQSTNDLIDWIMHFKKDYLIINNNDLIDVNYIRGVL